VVLGPAPLRLAEGLTRGGAAPTAPDAEEGAAAGVLGLAPLRLAEGGGEGARRAAAVLLGAVTLESAKTEAQLATIASLLRVWSAHVLAAEVDAGDGDGVCPLHEAWLGLLLRAVDCAGAPGLYI